MEIPGIFFSVGVSFKKTDIAHRSKFAFTPDQCIAVYTSNQYAYLQHYFILSTCNRTEIYGFAPCEYVPLILLQQHTGLPVNQLQQYVYIKRDAEAIEHFISVASGIDSQIPGDYEIIAQIKSAFQLAKEHHHTNGYIERLFNFGLQASKEVKGNTSFSDGTVSVMYAAAQKLSQKKGIDQLLLLGAGQTAIQVISYVKKLMPHTHITLINRDAAKGRELAGNENIAYAPFHALEYNVQQSDAVIVATNAPHPIVTKALLESTPVKYVFDLSVPQNVAPDVSSLSHIDVENVDSISEDTTATIQFRLTEIPKVKAIIRTYSEKFNEWAARHHYFSVASTASVAGNLLSRKELTSLFQEWHKVFQSDSTLSPYSSQTSASIINSIKSNFPAAELARIPKSEVHEACHPHCHPKQSACFMAGQCGSRPTGAVR